MPTPSNSPSDVHAGHAGQTPERPALSDAAIVRITADWQLSPLRPREQKIRELVRAQGADDGVAFYAVTRNGVISHIVPSAVCMAVLEYYAFEARGDNEQAAKSYRLLARKGFTDFIYAQVGYNPSGAADVAWKQFHDRVTLTYHTVPVGSKNLPISS
jgi:hypothetical protein